MAYRSLATSYGNIRFRPQRRKYMQKALELSDRLAEKERYFIEGDFYSYSEKTYCKAIDAYKKLLELYPDDNNGNNNLATMYSDVGEIQKAIDHYEINRKSGNMSLLGYGNLADVYRQVGSYGKAIEHYEKFLDLWKEADPGFPEVEDAKKRLAAL